ncbi:MULTISPECIES: chemotaxis-specific protein-glutamate methyltransferase CheB [Rhizobium/Agrobacterium group]|uniref:chemotaxis-specific protein-glutamate methyltransferase CheB n=1 Tax=Rhizobium/Agrobacterium group TaxID=227290 RepID=UPI0008DBF0EB|nr:MULTISPECIES: chemotaxis-specific protein-glutamate methyltransferase CheB [Rhizobium/Agrobacterium group]MCF1436983.1 chemotaxis-specific protein-glutamate methyltransferase CheB [Allorhizobium ampelinum]MCF1465089.1 chemotaxis-specific protein-glutamate methyltransferase CheB [Allorhizobium ampelinum]MCF1496220.1 chemotaxis-specific protein-glutamate methyltransferase CheB [Allorhizobium ampelinum]MUO92584.1 chemotaxis-specific protein-glutamate methyltransferase CheB [Agrobacterium vitis]
MIRLLIVEDSALMRKLLGQMFSAEGDFEIEFARDGVEALKAVSSFQPHVVTLDIHMPLMDGLACLDRIMLEHPCPVVMVSSLTEEGAEETLTALEIGAVDFIAKPGGAISLSINELTPRLVEKVRMAATVRIRRSRRLAERVRRTQVVPSQTIIPSRGRGAAPQRPVRDSSRTGLVLIGTSTGGPPALDAVLAHLPADFGCPVVVAQHMPASFTGPLARRLDKLCALTVSEVSQQTKLEPGNIYIAKGDADIIISSRAGSLVAMAAPSDQAYRWHPSVDRMVRSAMKHVPATDLVGILMTGMGNDGAAAMAELQAAGGYTIAESEETAVVWGMPGELVRLNGASEIRRVEDIGASLLDRVC